MLKNVIYSGIGAAMALKEKVEDEVKKLEDQGKLKKDDAKNFLDSIEQKGRDEEAKFKEQLKFALQDAIDDLGVATKADIEKLKEDLK